MILPYLRFNGNCEEAFLFYQQLFDGSISHFVRYNQAPKDSIHSLPPEYLDKVMHAEIMLTEAGGISGADVFEPVTPGSAISIHAHLKSEAQAQEILRGLSDGGTVLSALATNPPPDDHGVSGLVQDKFGINWVLSALKD